MTLDAKIEAILFWKGEPMAIKKLAAILEKSEQEIDEGLTELETKLQGRGLSLIRKDGEVMLGSAKEMGPTIEALVKEELVRDLGKAGLETLSIILYRGPVSRKDIDYIRGVNSQFILRNLLVRGLVERITNPKDERSFLYKPTFELLSYLGLGSLKELPEYNEIRKEIDTHE
jgi:segregation and condensation protein B